MNLSRTLLYVIFCVFFFSTSVMLWNCHCYSPRYLQNPKISGRCSSGSRTFPWIWWTNFILWQKYLIWILFVHVITCKYNTRELFESTYIILRGKMSGLKVLKTCNGCNIQVFQITEVSCNFDVCDLTLTFDLTVGVDRSSPGSLTSLSYTDDIFIGGFNEAEMPVS